MIPRLFLDRRQFLQRGVCALGAAAASPLWLSKIAWADGDGDPDRVLVVLQLSGGHDGLSTVVPFGEDAYYRARRALAVGPEGLHPLSDRIALASPLAKLARHWAEGRLTVVQGVGYPNPNRSHFESMDIWHTARLGGRDSDTGWLGRAMDEVVAAKDARNPPAVSLGRGLPYALRARTGHAAAFSDPSRFRWTGDPDDEGFQALNEERPAANEALEFLRKTAAGANASSERVRQAANGYRPGIEYPNVPLARDLGTVAALVDGGLGARAYYVTLGGFDTHTGQVQTLQFLQSQLDGALDAFLGDIALHGHARRVTLVAFSEFGRRVAENASGGTDHGAAGPVFVAGEAVAGGLVGEHPSLTQLDRGDLVAGIDFRRVYATLLDDWLGVSSEKVLGERFETLPLF